jgi:hypothetical protein
MSESEGAGLTEACEQAIRAELNRLLDSPAFRTSKRCREFLAYIVEHTVQGPSETLKERSIGMELFQLPPDFDTGQHTIVRVTASEVRKKLAQHYLAENGSYHAVRIDLPPGSYSAEFKWAAPSGEKTVHAATPPNRNEHGKPAESEWRAVPVAHASQQADVPERLSWLTRTVIACLAAVFVSSAVFFLWRGSPAKPDSVSAKSTSVPAALPNPSLGSANLRMIMGATTSYVDRSGRAWGPDRFFSGGTVLVRPSERVYRTLDPDIYRHIRKGDFTYNIPLNPGSYELHLHFAETGLSDFISAESSGEGQRLFRVSANDKTILDAFDVVADAAGSNISDERVFRDISPAPDGFLHLSFTSMRSTAVLSGVEVLPVSPGKVRPVRIRAGWTSAWRDSAGREWDADSHFLGGNALVRTTNPARESNLVPPDMDLYASERWGHFSYAVPVADGRYKVTLKFCEGHYGHRNTGVGGLGSRVFDVYCNGVALLRNFDIFKEAGGEGRPLDRTFTGIRPTAQGKIILTFVPVKGMACVNGIDVEED